MRCEKKHSSVSEKESLLPTKRIFATVAETFSLWCKKGKILCERPFALHRQQPEKNKQNVDFPLEKFLRTPMFISLVESSYLNISTLVSKSCAEAIFFAFRSL